MPGLSTARSEILPRATNTDVSLIGHPKRADTAREAMPAAERAMFDALSARAAEAGEPFLTAFDPATLPDELRAVGFAKILDATIGDILAKHFPNLPRSTGRGHIVHAMTS